ncbi:MAG: phosphate ABC transporter permease PstA [Hyphomicrobiales bacterium]|nr:phosphate ABC transporter permease PstA [Hyphomicrobiales bacterium]
MTDAAAAAQPHIMGEAAKRRRKRRYRAERRLRLMGLGAVLSAICLLGVLVTSITLTGYQAFVQTMITLDVFIDPELVQADDIRGSNWRRVFNNALDMEFPDVESPSDKRNLASLFTSSSSLFVRDRVLADPTLIGETITVTIAASDPVDQLNKGTVSRDTPESRRRISDQQIAWFDRLVGQERVSTPFNWGLVFNADSRFPEIAGLAGAITGSFYALLVCFLISFPLGIAAAVYLEEFASKVRWTDLIEVNINNLAAVPSIVFGLLGLAVFLNFFGLPRSAPLVGGMVLALMTLPTIIIATRAALKSVPPSIREAALGIGASRHETVMQHVLPLAMPGILTGTIIGLAQALGETAPLLLIGMNAFITSPPGGVMEPSTALPTQIFIWADSPERGFVARTSAGILVLLGFLVAMNTLAIVLRQRLGRRW